MLVHIVQHKNSELSNRFVLLLSSPLFVVAIKKSNANVISMEAIMDFRLT